MTEQRIEVTYTDGTTAEIELPAVEWGAPGSERFLSQLPESVRALLLTLDTDST